MMQDPPCDSVQKTDEADAIPGVGILGVRVHRVDMAGAVEAVRGFVRSGEPHMIVTADSSMIVLAQSDDEFKQLVNNADLVTPDSSGIMLAGKLLGEPFGAKVSGVELAREICRLSAEDGFGVYLLGAAPGVADEAAEMLRAQFPSIQIAGVHDGYFSPEQDAEMAAMVKASGAKAILVAMGIPRQERWIRDHIREMGVCAAIGVGGTFDVFSGRVKRAPEWMQRHGLEWAYRLAMNPKKISKVATLPRFLLMVLRHKWSRT